MRIDANSFYLVINPHPNSEDFEEVFVDAKRGIGDLIDLSEIYQAEHIYGIYSDRMEALKDAKELWDRHAKDNDLHPVELASVKKRFNAFVDGLEALSAKYHIAIRSTGGVIIFDEPTDIEYSRDHTSGDLWPQWEE